MVFCYIISGAQRFCKRQPRKICQKMPMRRDQSFAYASSLTGSHHSFLHSVPGTSTAMWLNQLSRFAPCQCLTLAGIVMTVPGWRLTAGLPLLLIPALAGRADQELASAGRGVMDVPVVAAARLKGDVCKKDGLLRIGQRIEEGRAGKILRVGGVFRASAKDVFLFKCGFILNFRDPYSFPLQSFSNSFATSSSSWRMGRCCGQTFSHLPHFTQSDALRPGAVCTSL